MRVLPAAIACALAAGLALCPDRTAGAGGGGSPPARRSAGRQMAVTFDDLPGVVAPGEGLRELRALTERLVSRIAAERIPAIGFVNEGKLAPDGSPVSARRELLSRWVEAGLELGNHTYSHLDLHRASLEEFEADLLRGQEATRALLAKSGGRPRFLRHPLLHTGRSLETKHALEEFLSAHGYRVAPVTIDNSEWIFARAYALARARSDGALARRVAAAYGPYMEAKTAYYERQSLALFSREIPQVLLLHANMLNADRFSDLVRRLRGRGYAFVTLERALEDSAYRSPDSFTGPAGISWLHRWALTSGGTTAVLPGEPRCPHFVQEAAGISEQ